MPAPSSARRRRARPPRHRPLEAVARVIDAVPEDDPCHLAVYVAEPGDGAADDVELGLRPLPPGHHPFTELAGLQAPPSWSMFGLRVHGTGHHLQESRSERATTTFLVARTGEEITLLRMGGAVAEVPEAAQGTLPDLCRRVLGLPTAPAPASTGLVHALAWLDAVLERWGDPSQRRHLSRSFAAVAACHPAVAGGEAPTTPEALVAVAREHTAAWPWSRLRAAPDALPLPGGSLPPATAAWMDDGFFARWALGAFPDTVALATDVTALLGGEVGPLVRQVLVAALTPDPS